MSDHNTDKSAPIPVELPMSQDKDGKALTKFEGAPVIAVDDKPNSFEKEVVDIVRPQE